MINLGLRHDIQTHLGDQLNFSPRLGISWTPSSKVRTTLRASAGIVRSAMDAGIYQQLLLVDGRAQHDLVISSPGYPDPFSAGLTQATALPSIIRARYRSGDAVQLSVYRGRRSAHRPFLPVPRHVVTSDRIRPLSEAEMPTRPWTASGRTRRLATLRSWRIPPDHGANRSRRKCPSTIRLAACQRLSATSSGEATNETDGPFSLPPDNVDLTGEWGPSRADVRHSVNAGLNTDLIGGFRVGANVRAQSALPYNITLGTDPNSDGISNERPVGVTRNSGRGAPTTNVDLMLTWRLSLGQRRSERSPGGDRGTHAPTVRRDNDVFRFEVFARATNVLNTVNPLSFSGVLTSPFFGSPTSASAGRRVVLGTRVWF